MWWLVVLISALVNSGGLLEQRAEVAPREEATQEVRSGLKVVGIYGERNDTSSDLRILRVNVELAYGAHPEDLTRLMLRYSDGSRVQTYAWGEEPIERQDPREPTWFATTWIRGSGDGGVAVPGDLVEIAFVVAEDLPERTTVMLSLIPETGPQVEADFRTPATYSTYTIVTLR